MAGHPYKASKAWHIGHELALDVHRLATQLAERKGQSELTIGLRKSSSTVPLQIRESHTLSLRSEKLECYRLAREALTELQAHLLIVRDMRHISHRTHQDFSKRAAQIYQLLNELIRTAKDDVQAPALDN